MAGAQKKNLDSPDERLEFEGVAANVVQVADAAISRNVFQPGAHCALGGRRLLGNHRAEESCQAHHSGVVLEGRLHIEMDDGSVLDVGPNEVYDIPPGHDGWTTSEQPLLAINWSGVRSWLPEPESGDRVARDVALHRHRWVHRELAVQLGDTAWRELLGRHFRDVRNVLDRHRGREVTTTGDGFLAVFDGAARAVRAALSIRDGARRARDRVSGPASTPGKSRSSGTMCGGSPCTRPPASRRPHRAAEILVSATTCQLASGSGFTFEERGERALKGLAEPRLLFAVSA